MSRKAKSVPQVIDFRNTQQCAPKGKITRLFSLQGWPAAGATPLPGQNLITTLKSGPPAAKSEVRGLARLMQKARAVPSGVTSRPSETRQAPSFAGGRLAFMIDATLSRSHAWLEATKIQRRMVEETRRFGRLSLRLAYFRGQSALELYPDGWTDDPGIITAHMDTIRCASGHTQIARALGAVLLSDPPPNAIVAIGDCCEEKLAPIREAGRALGGSRIPVFAFLDGHDRAGEEAYRALAADSGGVFARFGDKLNLGPLIVAAGAYTAGGAAALLMLCRAPDAQGRAALECARQLKLPPPQA